MQLDPAQIQHLRILKSWISDHNAAYYWSGSGLRYPFTDESFLEDIQWGKMPSYSLVSSEGELLGFGQYYDNHGRCHLARLVIAPQHRGKGLGRRLIKALIPTGLADLSLTECSLFVFSNNTAAVRCYQSSGFVESPWPEWQKRHGGIAYMVRHA